MYVSGSGCVYLQGVCCEIVSSRNIRRYTLEISATLFHKYYMNKNKCNRHVDREEGKLRGCET